MKNGSAQYCLIMFEKWKSVIVNGNYVCVILMDLPIIFDTINHELPMAKLEAHGPT